MQTLTEWVKVYSSYSRSVVSPVIESSLSITWSTITWIARFRRRVLGIRPRRTPCTTSRAAATP